MKILVVDDDEISREVLQGLLEKEGHEVTLFEDARSALAEFPVDVDLVISDFFMPGMDGATLYDEVRLRNRDVPFIFVTAAREPSVVIELMRRGASDLVRKPVRPETLRLRLDRVMQDARYRKQIARLQAEEALIELENQKLNNWRFLYAAGATGRADDLIDDLSRNINQSGGFYWVEMLKEMAEPYDEERFLVPRAVLEMVMTSARQHQTLMDHITAIGALNRADDPLPVVPLPELLDDLEQIVGERMLPLARQYRREVTVHPLTEGSVVSQFGGIWDSEMVDQILWELVCNGIKYSPEQSALSVKWSIPKAEEGELPELRIELCNSARHAVATDMNGEPILGVPPALGERVFELFFTIDSFPTTVPEERWQNGSGLAFVRALSRRLGGSVEIATDTVTREVTVTLSLKLRSLLPGD